MKLQAGSLLTLLVALFLAGEVQAQISLAPFGPGSPTNCPEPAEAPGGLSLCDGCGFFDIGSCVDLFGTGGGLSEAWYARGHALWLRRNEPRSELLVTRDVSGTDGDPSDDEPAITTDDDELEFQDRVGAMFTIGTELWMGTRLESTYFGLHEWDRTKAVTGFDDLDQPFRPGTFPVPGGSTFSLDNGDLATAQYESDLNNVEVNLLHDVGERLSLLAGARYMRITETLNVITFDGLDNDIAEFDDTFGQYKINTKNDLVGGQIGANLMILHWWDRLRLDIGGKAGAYANFAETNQFVGDISNTLVRRNSRDSSQDVAFIGEVNITLTFRLTECLSIRGGYMGFWVEGIALAPEQADYRPEAAGSPDINDDGGVFYEGGFVGLELRR